MKEWTLLMALLMSAGAYAASAPVPKVGVEAREWIELQKHADTDKQRAPRPLPGEVADKIYQRYVDSFSRPIPATFPRDSFSGDSGSGGK